MQQSLVPLAIRKARQKGVAQCASFSPFCSAGTWLHKLSSKASLGAQVNEYKLHHVGIPDNHDVRYIPARRALGSLGLLAAVLPVELGPSVCVCVCFSFSGDC